MQTVGSFFQANRSISLRSVLSVPLMGMLVLLASASTSLAQLTGVKSIPGDYASLTLAIADLASNGVGAGGVVLELQPGYSSGSESYPILLPVISGASGSNRVTIRPASSISSAISFSSSAVQTFNIEGGDFYQIDGRPGGVGSSRFIEVYNTSTTGISIRLANDATNNVLRNLVVEGRNSSATAGGVVVLAPGTNISNTAGVSNNELRNNLIRSVSPNFAANLLLSEGSSNAGWRNASNTIADNEFDNFLNNGIFIDGANQGAGSSWVISGNSVYNSTAVSTAVQTGINFRPGTNSSGNTVTGNFVGGTAVLAGGSRWLNSQASGNLVGIFFSSNSTVANAITNNTVQNIASQVATSVNMAGIWLEGGTRLTTRTQITGNIIGHISDESKGLQHIGTTILAGIFTNTTSRADVNIANNEIANLVHAGTGTSATVRGIDRRGESASSHIDNNLIHDLKETVSNNSSGTNLSVMGIFFFSSFNQATTDNRINGNTIYNLSNPSANEVGSNLAGIYIAGSTGFNISGSVAQNRIYGFTATGNLTTTRTISGIINGIGNWTFANNQISLTNGSNTNPATLIGIYDVNGGTRTTRAYNNSIYLGGISSGTSYSYGYARFLKTNARLYNNIFYNARTGGISNLAIANANTVNNDGLATDNWPATGSNYNLFVASNLSSAFHWVDPSTSSPTAISAWRASSGGDANSWVASVAQLPVANLFTNTAIGNLSIRADQQAAWYVNGKGVAGTTIDNLATDFDGTARGTVFGFGNDIGSDEFSIDPVANQPHNIVGLVSNPGVVSFMFGGNTIASIDVVDQGSLSLLILRYFTGEEVPSPISGKEYHDQYWRVIPDVAGGFTYNATFNYQDHLRGNMPVEDNATERLSQLNPCSKWTQVSVTADVVANSLVSSLVSDATELHFVGTSSANPLDNFTPSNLLAPVINNNYVDLSWSDLSADSYEVQYSSNPNFPTDLTGAVTQTATTPDLLLALEGATYKWRVRAICGTSAGIYANGTDFTTVGTLSCVAPFNPQVEVVGNQVTFSWEVPVPNNITQFTVRYSSTPGFPVAQSGQVTLTTSSSSITVTIPDGAYKWTLRSTCPLSSSSIYTSEVFEVGSIPPCSQPSGLIASQAFDGKTTFSWSAVPSVASYTLQYSSNSSFPTDLTGAVTVTTTSTSRTINSLPAGNYKWRVKSNCGIRESEYTNGTDILIQTLPVGCANPVPAPVTVVGNTVTFNWTHPNAQFVQNYTLEYSANPEFPTAMSGAVSLLVSSFPHTVTGVPNAPFRWRIRANCINSTNRSSFVTGTPFEVGTSNPSCATPTNANFIQTASPENYKTTISWTSSVGAIGYHVEYSSNPAFPADETGSVRTYFSGTGTSKNIVLPGPGTYKWRVRSRCSSTQFGFWLNGSPITVTDVLPACIAPVATNPSVVYNDVNNTALVKWTQPTGIFVKNYVIEYGIGNYATVVTSNVGTSQRSLPISAIGTYQWRIKTICIDGTSSDYINGTDFTVAVLREGVNHDDLQTEELDSDVVDMICYPNPAKDRLVTEFTTESTDPINISIFDMNGRLLLEKQLNAVAGQNRIELDVTDFTAGMYTVTARQANQMLTRRISVVH